MFPKIEGWGAVGRPKLKWLILICKVPKKPKWPISCKMQQLKTDRWTVRSRLTARSCIILLISLGHKVSVVSKIIMVGVKRKIVLAIGFSVMVGRVLECGQTISFIMML